MDEAERLSLSTQHKVEKPHETKVEKPHETQDEGVEAERLSLSTQHKVEKPHETKVEKPHETQDEGVEADFKDMRSEQALWSEALYNAELVTREAFYATGGFSQAEMRKLQRRGCDPRRGGWAKREDGIQYPILETTIQRFQHLSTRHLNRITKAVTNNPDHIYELMGLE